MALDLPLRLMMELDRPGDAINVLRSIRANDPTLWEALWRIEDGARFGDYVWLSGRGWSNLPGSWVTRETYDKLLPVVEERKKTYPRNAELERVLRVSGEKGQLIEAPTGWRDERLDDVAEGERAARILGEP